MGMSKEWYEEQRQIMTEEDWEKFMDKLRMRWLWYSTLGTRKEVKENEQETGKESRKGSRRTECTG